MIQQITFWQYQCDGCGKVARVEAFGSQAARLPVTWRSAKTEHAGHPQHFCLRCANERGLIHERETTAPR